MRVVDKILWYGVNLNKELTDSRGNKGGVEVRVRSFFYETNSLTEEGRAINEESFCLKDSAITAVAQARGLKTWDEDDLRTLVGKVLGKKVE